MSPADPTNPNEAARLTQQLIDQGYTKRQVAKMLGRDASLVSQFFTKGKGASMVGALRQLVRAVRGGQRDEEALSAVAGANTKRRTTKGGQKARVRGKDTIGTPGGSMAGRAGKQAIKSGAAHLAPVVHETGQAGGRLAFTVRMKADQYVYSAGSEKDSGGVRRGFIPRSDGTEERTLRRRRVVPARRRPPRRRHRGHARVAGGDRPRRRGRRHRLPGSPRLGAARAVAPRAASPQP